MKMEKFEKLPKNRCFSATHRRLLAGRTLEKLKAGKLEILSEVVSDFERLEDIKNKESTIKIKSWFAGDRKEDKTKRLSHTGLKGIMETVANLCQRVLR